MLYQFIKRLDTETRLGKRVISHIIPETYRKKFSAQYKERSRVRTIRKICRKRKSQVKDLFNTCLAHILPVKEPLALISQGTCSGGMLLNQLFDGHPEIHCYPHELLIGDPSKNQWPQIDAKDDPRRLFEILFEKNVFKYARNGYYRQEEEQQPLPFIFLPSLQKEIFLKYLNALSGMTPRDILDAYMTSYFGAWLNNQNVNGSKKFVTAYSRGLSMSEDNMQFLFDLYPDGRLISVVRDPLSWLSCARSYEPEKDGEFEKALSQWEAGARAMLRNRQRYGERVCIIRFEDLLSKTAAVMHHLAEFMEIEFSDTLLVPTFNTFALKGLKSLQEQGYGQQDKPSLEDMQLTRRQKDIIERMNTENYSKVLSKAHRF